MTVKITQNDRGIPMTSTERQRFSDQEIAQAATPTRSTESSAPEDPAFERHYRIGDLAEMWRLGRETVRLLEPTGGLMSALTGVSGIHFLLTAKRKKARRTPRRRQHDIPTQAIASQ